MKQPGEDKILLVLLPFWDPQIPALGLSCLKSFLQPHGFHVKTVDVNINLEFREIQDQYREALIRAIPGQAKGNFDNIVHEVLGNHLMGFLHREDETAYNELVEILIDRTFFHRVSEEQLGGLNELIAEFYRRLETYFLELLEEQQPMVLGVSVYGDNLGPSMFVCQLTREHYPHIKTVMGGGIFAEPLALGSPNLEYFLEKTPYIDKIIIGEGELLFLEWLKDRLPSSQRVYTYRDREGQYLDLSTVEIPDFSDFDLRHYPYLSLYGSRSCPFQCRFCSETVIWGKYRQKNAGQIVKEMEKLYRLYRHQLFFMGDSLLDPFIDNLAGECIESGKAFYWDGHLRAGPNACNNENTLKWRRGGFYRARLGLESGSQRILDLMNKKITLDQGKKTLINLARSGIKTTTFWVIGFPGETKEDFQLTLDFIEEMKDEIYEADCNPFIYGLAGQVNSNEWAGYSRKPLYPGKTRKMLILETWLLDCEPYREEVYRRVELFIEHIRRLGIPNPYSLHDVHKADQRWQRLHKNAVPPLIRFRDQGIYLQENKHIKQLQTVKNTQADDEGFDF